MPEKKTITAKQFLPMAGTILAAATLTATAQTADKPNILFITVDDLKPMLGCYGDETILTPNINRLAARGTVFLNNYCQQAVCAPSRMSIFTGLRPDTTGVTDLQTDLREHQPDAKTIQQLFREHGYETLGCGKVMHGVRHEDPPSWSTPYMYDAFLTYADGWPVPADLEYQGTHSHEAFAQIQQEGLTGWLEKRNRMIELEARPAVECIDAPDDAYPDGAMATWALGQIKLLANVQKPFFITVGFHKPHLPFTAPKKYWDLYERSQFQLPPVQEPPQNSPAFAGQNWPELRAYTDMPKEGPLPAERQAELIHAYHACVSYTDAQIGRLLDALDDAGQMKNTIVILWGDHGWHLGDHGWWCKHTNYEQATKAPLIIAAPHYNPGRANTMSEFVDVYPTLCELADVPAPNGLEGTSLIPALKNPNVQIKKYAISQYPRDDLMGYAYRDKRYRYVEWVKKNGDAAPVTVARELYDYTTDPQETHNLIDDPAYTSEVTRMETLITEPQTY